jgi:sulfite reductase beta subunit-like hemoprotein
MKNLSMSLYVLLDQSPARANEPEKLDQLREHQRHIGGLIKEHPNTGYLNLSVAAYGNPVLYGMLAQDQKNQLAQIADTLGRGMAQFLAEQKVQTPGQRLVKCMKAWGIPI